MVVLAACGQTTEEEADPTSTPSDGTSDPGEPDDGTDDGDPDDESDPDDGDPDETDGEPSGVGALAFTDCETQRYTVGYPQQWRTNDDEDRETTVERSSGDPDGGPLTIADVRLGSHGAFDRVTFEIAGDGDAGLMVEHG